MEFGLHLLQPGIYPHIQRFFMDPDDQLAPIAVLQGAAVGQVWAASVDGVPAAVLVHTGYRLYLGGDAADSVFIQAFRRWLVIGLLPEMRATGEWGVAIYYTSSSWKPVLDDLLSGLQAFWGARYYYERTLDPDQPIAVPGLPTDFALLQVDRVLVSRADLQGMGVLLEEMRSERVSTDDFLAHSFGYALLAGANIAGWCLSEYNLAQRCEVGIATLEPHQRRGLATANGLALLDLARAQGITRVGWHCWANNRASSATAEKLGFSRVREYGSFGCPANPAQA